MTRPKYGVCWLNVPSSTPSLHHLFLCIETVKPLEPPHYNMYLALLPLIPVLYNCMCWFLMLLMAELACGGGSGSEHVVFCLQLADLVPREVHIRTELSFSAV